MEATFEIIAADGARIDEDELEFLLEHLRPSIGSIDEREGMLILYNSGGSFRVTAFRDSISPLIRAVCIDAVPDLAAGKDVEIQMAAYNERAWFKIEGDAIVVTGDAIEEDRCPARPLLEALVGCGERFAALVKKLYSTNPNMADVVANWDQAVAQARASLV